MRYSTEIHVHGYVHLGHLAVARPGPPGAEAAGDSSRRLGLVPLIRTGLTLGARGAAPSGQQQRSP